MRFFFDLVSPAETIKDEEGVVAPSLDEARREALIAIGETLRDKWRAPAEYEGWRVEVRDENGSVLDILDLSSRSS
jgi:hypothetical protein